MPRLLFQCSSDARQLIGFGRWGWTPSRSCRRGVSYCSLVKRMAALLSAAPCWLFACGQKAASSRRWPHSFMRPSQARTQLLQIHSEPSWQQSACITLSPPYLPRYSGTEDTREVLCALPRPNLPRLATLSVLLLCSVTPGRTSARAVDLQDYRTEDIVGIAHHV